MKKIIILDRVKQRIVREFFDALSDVEMHTAYSNADAIRIHRGERAALIISELYGSGMNARQFCAQVREDEDTRAVSIIVCCRDNEIERREAGQCRANAVLAFPLSAAHLRDKVRRFLSVPSRSRYRAAFSARTSSSPRLSFDCRCENISVTGMLIEADAELRRGDLLQYSLDLTPARSFAMHAEVVRTERGRYGVRFSRLDPAARSAIEVMVAGGPSAR